MTLPTTCLLRMCHECGTCPDVRQPPAVRSSGCIMVLLLRDTKARNFHYKTGSTFYGAYHQGHHLQKYLHRARIARGQLYCFLPVKDLRLVQPKVRVRVPRFRRKVRPEDVPSYPVGGGKRKASLILEKAREELENMSLPPPPTKPVLDDKEKKRLQTIFAWHGLLDEGEVIAPPKAIPPRLQVKKGSKEEKEALLDLISKEIQEREEFLHDMQELGKDDMYRSQIESEILDRVKQMKQLDKLLTAEEKQSLSRSDENPCPKKTVTWDF